METVPWDMDGVAAAFPAAKGVIVSGHESQGVSGPSNPLFNLGYGNCGC